MLTLASKIKYRKWYICFVLEDDSLIITVSTIKKTCNLIHL